MTSVRVIKRPYTSPLVRNPTYPVVMPDHRIVEASWSEEGETFIELEWTEADKAWVKQFEES